MIIVSIYIVKNEEVTVFQRWTASGIIGGGFGNLIDRFFRPEGVVDFLDVKFYGLFGLDRWPTFNVADSAVVVCGTLLFVSMLIPPRKAEKSSLSGSDNDAGDKTEEKDSSGEVSAE